ncbi:MAG: membrane-bound O-acyltransferase family protein, partial [Pseudomonas sp.]
WRLSELASASLTSLQIYTLLLAYAVLAIFGIRQFFADPLGGAPKAKAMEAGDAAVIAAAPGGAAVYQPSWVSQLPQLATRVALLLLFAAAVLKLSAQSFSPFLYFQF